jgi:hypothetical protein
MDCTASYDTCSQVRMHTYGNVIQIMAVADVVPKKVTGVYRL